MLNKVSGLVADVLGFISNYEKNRPRIKVTDLTLNTKEVEIFAAADSEYLTSKLINTIIETGGKEKYIHIVSNKQKLNKTTLLYPNEHLLDTPNDSSTYMFVNLCTKDEIVNQDDIVLAFGVLNIELKLDIANISSLKIHRAYSMRTKKKSLGKGLKIDVCLDEIPEFKSPLKIPVAYAFAASMETSLHIPKIDKLKHNEAPSGKKLRLSESRVEIAKYIAFHETAYLLKYKSPNSILPYYYSVFLSKKNKKLNNIEQETGKKLFKEKAKLATKEAGHPIVKKSVKRKRRTN